MGILGNEAADVLAKNAAEGVPPDDHAKMDVWGGYRAVGQAAEEEVSGEGRTWRRWEGSDRESNEVEAEGSNKLLPTARRKGHREVVG